MKKFLVLLAATVLSLAVASASPIPCTVSGATSVTLGNSTSPNFTCGTLTFDNFQVVSSFGGAIGRVDLYTGVSGPTYDSATGQVDFSLNPNLGSAQDIGLLFEVWGGITQVNLGVGGSDASVSELVCSAPIPTTGPGAFLCPTGSFLGSVTDFSNDPAAPLFSQSFSTTSPVYIFKNIETGNGTPTGTGHLSVFTQSFEVNNVPEPISMVLLGSGLLGVGLLRRRIRKN